MNFHLHNFKIFVFKTSVYAPVRPKTPSPLNELIKTAVYDLAKQEIKREPVSPFELS